MQWPLGRNPDFAMTWNAHLMKLSKKAATTRKDAIIPHSHQKLSCLKSGVST